jgi:protein-disulfide isomerase
MSDKKGRLAGGKSGLLLAGAVGLLIGGGAMVLAQGGLGESRTERIVHDYILENPEIIPEAMERLQQREAAAAIEPRRAQLETPYAGAWAGAADGDVVLVEFFDYACGYCRASNPVVERLLREDPRLKVVWRELPVLGPNSQDAAFVSLAAADQNRFRQFHDALFALGPPSAQSIAQAQRAVGVQPAQSGDGHRQELQRNMELANLLRVTGTPAFVVGDQVLHGAVGYERLKQAIEQARTAT